MKRLLLTGCLVLAACVARGNDPAPIAAPQTGAPPVRQANRFSGKVAETTNAASYTYICVDTGTKIVWAAAPQFAVRVGDSVAIADGMPMPNYHSKTLDRTFDVVYFTDRVVVNGAKPGDSGAVVELPKNHPPITGAATRQKLETKVDLSGIKKARDGKTIAEIFAGKAKLAGRQVAVRGKVVEYNAMIMGKNWFHLRDGSGSEGSNDLTVTTAAEVKIGDTVLVSGVVSADKDFGAGYKYALLIENAEVVVESRGQTSAHKDESGARVIAARRTSPKFPAVLLIPPTLRRARRPRRQRDRNAMGRLKAAAASHSGQVGTRSQVCRLFRIGQLKFDD